MKYKASLDQTAKMLTGLTFVILAYAIIRLGFHHHFHVYRIVILCFILTVLLIIYLYTTQSYEVSKSDVIINRKIGDRKIPLTSIQEIKRVTKDDLGWGLRVCGNSGFFGYSGLYYFSKIKWVWLSAMQRINYVLILTKDGKKRIITPDELGLVELVNSTIQGFQNKVLNR